MQLDKNAAKELGKSRRELHMKYVILRGETHFSELSRGRYRAKTSFARGRKRQNEDDEEEDEKEGVTRNQPSEIPQAGEEEETEARKEGRRTTKPSIIIVRPLTAATTGPPDRMSHRKWRETKQQPSRARSSNQLSCCLVPSISCATSCFVTL